MSISVPGGWYNTGPRQQTQPARTGVEESTHPTSCSRWRASLSLIESCPFPSLLGRNVFHCNHLINTAFLDWNRPLCWFGRHSINSRTHSLILGYLSMMAIVWNVTNNLGEMSMYLPLTWVSAPGGICITIILLVTLGLNIFGVAIFGEESPGSPALNSSPSLV